MMEGVALCFDDDRDDDQDERRLLEFISTNVMTATPMTLEEFELMFEAACPTLWSHHFELGAELMFGREG